jgi:serine/threonine-protein kinase
MKDKHSSTSARLGAAGALVLFCLVLAGSLAMAFQVRGLRPDLRLTLVDRQGQQSTVVMVPPSTFAPRVSPNGMEYLYDTTDTGAIWMAKFSDPRSVRRISEGRERGAIFSGDGSRLLYVTDYENEEALFWRALDGAGQPELLVKPARAVESWASPAQRFSFIKLTGAGDYDVWTYSLSEKRAEPFVVVPGSPQHSSRFSPDGRWIAYVSGETGRLEVYIQAFPGPGQRIQVSKSGGGHPLWSPDQRELFFDNNNQMFVVPVQTTPNLSAGEPQALPIRGFVQGPLRRQYDMTTDGKRFLMLFRN